VKVLVVGGGGREHALSWALAREADVFCAPGNPGTAEVGTNVPVSPSDHGAILAAAREHRIDLVVVGPEAPLAAGIVDLLTGAGVPVFGPTAAAARIESSKAFAKEVMRQAGVATAASATFTEPAAALAHVDARSEPMVVKASGLAAGKGVIVCPARSDARLAVTAMFEGKFGDAGREVLIEDYLEGEELSVLALTDGQHLCLLPAAQDHKRLGEGDTGPNTGGMGAYTPVSIATPELVARVERDVLKPVLQEMANRRTPFRGVLYAGLMVDPSGRPLVLEFNCRFGDPEAQVVLPAVSGGLLDAMWGAATDRWSAPPAFAAGRACVTTVLAAPGYPDAPLKGAVITLPPGLPADTLLFHAGTTRKDGALRTAGGRVLCATGLGPDVATAAERSRDLARQIVFEGAVYRRDIAWREVARAGAA
jgi:phosphoribosylamine--glycine ligase